MKKSLLLAFLFCMGIFVSLPSFLGSLTTYAVTCSQLTNGTCGLNGATCQFEGGHTDSNYACTGSYPCCIFGSPTTPTPTNTPSGGGGGCTGDACYIGRVCNSPYTNGTCQYRSSYPCSGSWQTGYCPGSTNVVCCIPAAATPTPTPTPTLTPTPVPNCTVKPVPIGSIISTGVAISASSTRNNNTNCLTNPNYCPGNIVNGQIDSVHYWDSGQGPTGWVEINLGAKQTVTGLQLQFEPPAAGVSTIRITAGTSPNPGTPQPSQPITCNAVSNQILNIPFDAALTNIQYLRITTTASPSNVAWKEISVYGSAPGSQTTTPGILFSGDRSSAFGQGNASVNKWVVGGLTWPEVFNAQRAVDADSSTGDSTTVKSLTSVTSYQHIFDRVRTAQAPYTDISRVTDSSGARTCSNLSNCTLPSDLPNGVYVALGPLSLNTYSFPTNKNYIFLINGDLTILGNIIVPNGSTAFFASKGSIIVTKNVGTATNLFPLPAGQLQGIYSADKDFIIEGIDRGNTNDCTLGKDKMLNIEGAIVTNALGNGGNFLWHRDLCGDNPRYPTFTIRARLDMLLNLPEILMQRSTTFREDAP